MPVTELQKANQRVETAFGAEISTSQQKLEQDYPFSGSFVSDLSDRNISPNDLRQALSDSKEIMNEVHVHKGEENTVRVHIIFDSNGHRFVINSITIARDESNQVHYSARIVETSFREALKFELAERHPTV